jgi:hypothetical protein
MEIEDSAIPLVQYAYGDPEHFALTIDVFPDGGEPYQARAWVDGDTTDLQYFASFDDCVAWFRTFPTPAAHGMPEGQEPAVVGLAPQSSDNGKTVTWALIDIAHVDTWWDGGDFPERNIGGKSIILFDDMAEDPTYAVAPSGPRI